MREIFGAGVRTADVISFFAEYFIILWFFQRVENQTGRWRRLAGCLCLSALCYLYLTATPAELFPLHSLGHLAIQIGRMVFHTAVIELYLTLTKELETGCAAYQAGYFTVLYLTVQNLRGSMLLLIRVAQTAVFSAEDAALLAILIELVLVAAIRRMVPLPEGQRVGGIRWATLSLAIMLQLYFKWLLVAMREQPVQYQSSDTAVFAVCASLGVLLILSLFEVNQRAQAERSQAQMEQVSLNYEMQNAKRALQTNNDIRRLYHDMKNHLLAIQGMAGRSCELQAYLKDLLPRFESYENQVFTGISTVDSLLSEKIQRAVLDDIRFNICLNLSDLSFVKSVDFITIFGNAVDNAIEAVQMLPTGMERMIYLKSSRFANLTALRFSNQFAGTRIASGGVLPTGKADAAMHGIGLNSIQKTVNRYGGSVNTEIDNEHGWFNLIIMIPDQSK